MSLPSSFAKWTPPSSELTVTFRASIHKRTSRMAPAGAAGRYVTRPQSLRSPYQSVCVEATKSRCQCHRVPNKTRFLSPPPVDQTEARDGVGTSPGDSPAIPKPKRRNPVAKDIVFL